MKDDKKTGKNFSETESSHVIDLVLPHKNIVENIKVS